MAEIRKNDAIVLKKTKFSESSLIVQLYTRKNGKMSVIVKGARSPKSKIGSKIDLLNQVEVVIYNKEEKNLQLATQVNLTNHFPHIREDLDKIKYASAICELLLNLTPENEGSDRIFRGVVKIFQLMNQESKNELLHFAQFMLFFIKEIGFQISFDNCSNCGQKIDAENRNAFSYSEGIICEECNEDKMLTFQFSEELFNLFRCLTSKNNIKSYKEKSLQNIIFILEKFLIYHNPDFKGLKSLQIL